MWVLYVFLVGLLLIQITGKPQWNPNGCFNNNCPMVIPRYIPIKPQEPHFPMLPPVRQMPYMHPIYPINVPIQVNPIDAFHLYIHHQPLPQGFVPTITSIPNVNQTSTISTNTTTELFTTTEIPAPTRQAYLCPDASISPCRNRRQISSYQPVACEINNDCSNITTTETLLCCEDPCLNHFVCKTPEIKFI